MKLGCHVGMSGKDMFLGSVKEAIGYGCDTFMVYTGAPQNTRRKSISELNIEEGHRLMEQAGITEFVVHAPYIINLANTVNPETYRLAVDFLKLEMERTAAMGARTLVLHPGSHVGAGEEAGLAQIINGLNEVLAAVPADQNPCCIALETMAGKGSELGKSFEELSRIYEGVHERDRLRICMDTCHLSDAGYPVRDDFDKVLSEFKKYFSLEEIACIHLNDSKNAQGAAKDRHENLGFGTLGFDALCAIVRRPEFCDVPIILETPYLPKPGEKVREFPPYKQELSMLRDGKFRKDLLEWIWTDAGVLGLEGAKCSKSNGEM